MIEREATALKNNKNEKYHYHDVIEKKKKNAFSAMEDNDLDLNRYIPRGSIANHWALIDGDEYGGDFRKYINSLPATKKYKSGFALDPAIRKRLPLINSISSTYRIGPRYDSNYKYVPLDASSIVKRELEELEELGENAPVKDFGSFIHNINKNNFVVDTGGDDDNYWDTFSDSPNDEPSSQTQHTKKENTLEDKKENTPKNKKANLFPTGLGNGY